MVHEQATERIKQQHQAHEHRHGEIEIHITREQYTNTKQLQQCQVSHFDMSYVACLQKMRSTEQTSSTRYIYDFYFIEPASKSALQWIVSPYRSAWVYATEQSMKYSMDAFHNVLNRMLYTPLQPSHIDIGVKDQIFSFTLLNSEPERGHNYEWNMHDIHAAYLSPFFHRVANLLLYAYHIDSQILHYGYILSPPPTDDIHVDQTDFNTVVAKYIRKDEAGNYFYVTNKELQTFVGGTDWNRISSLVNDVSPVQFMVYIPPKKYLPLHIKSAAVNDSLVRSQYDAFIVPRFGGCVVYNPSPALMEANAKKRRIKLQTTELSDTFNVIVSQLRSMFGLRNDYSSDDDDDGDVGQAKYLMHDSGINDWELDLLIREYIVHDLHTVEIALMNIYAMIEKVSQLPINQEVATLISDAVYAFDEALFACNRDQDFNACIQWTRHSNYLAKKAEYHPSMLPVLYFSPEFTYAVYSPYFLPGYIPIVAAVIKKLKAKFKAWKEKRNIQLDAVKKNQ
eukprot:CAMPEP_0202691398 /NCGR_PEP_ID=MMETSP1385-20130828/6127_1 /ASSEMBLY_ACC=CAM_ASM_000861 /TAXON_ID=933848 /ORGANISM="Elphidium margaritaceum" /LENGTH=508 /DNA_ID=CAMNT_0049346799 /DNA_START=168 /DNA_END=1694 /DNA_ORIENTATION=+